MAKGSKKKRGADITSGSSTFAVMFHHATMVLYYNCSLKRPTTNSWNRLQEKCTFNLSMALHPETILPWPPRLWWKWEERGKLSSLDVTLNPLLIPPLNKLNKCKGEAHCLLVDQVNFQSTVALSCLELCSADYIYSIICRMGEQSIIFLFITYSSEPQNRQTAGVSTGRVKLLSK